MINLVRKDKVNCTIYIIIIMIVPNIVVKYWFFIIDTDHNLQIDNINLDNLLIQLKAQVSSKWYQFGAAAGIDKEVLDNYVKNCSPDECIIEIFDYWLRNYKGKISWHDVAAILRAINLQQLAFDIEQVYVTGKYYRYV